MEIAEQMIAKVCMEMVTEFISQCPLTIISWLNVVGDNLWRIFFSIMDNHHVFCLQFYTNAPARFIWPNEKQKNARAATKITINFLWSQILHNHILPIGNRTMTYTTAMSSRFFLRSHRFHNHAPSLLAAELCPRHTPQQK